MSNVTASTNRKTMIYTMTKPCPDLQTANKLDKGAARSGLQGEEVVIVSFIEPLPSHSKTFSIQNPSIHV
jgi:hypothetical protein